MRLQGESTAGPDRASQIGIKKPHQFSRLVLLKREPAIVSGETDVAEPVERIGIGSCMKRSRARINHFIRYVGATVAVLLCLAAAACWAAAPGPALEKQASLVGGSTAFDSGRTAQESTMNWLGF